MFFPAMPWTRAQRERDEFSYQVLGHTHFIWVCTYITFVPLLLGTLKLTCSSSNHTGIPSPQRNPGTRLCHLHTQCAKNVPHKHSSATAPSARTIFHFYLHDKSKSRVFKSAGKESNSNSFPPSKMENRKKQKKICFCQASTEYTAFHFIKTIIQKPAKNYIKLPPCTTPSPFLQPLLPTNSLPALQGQNHSTGPAPNPSQPPGSPSPHTASSRAKHRVRGLQHIQPPRSSQSFTSPQPHHGDLLQADFSLTFDGKVASNIWSP